ncbi:MAG: dipicolinate synthase subunit B [Oscillospiraceae bacterium]|nr:dipicolinate synthase subunit B [Oscillospiraceae bacterium]MDY3937520.1 dipicolinate synthase subunit B [Oscillospiraceae bacterium]
MDSIKVGFAMCGSFCTFSKAIESIENLINKGVEIVPIMSYNAYSTDTRFGRAKEHIEKIENLCSRKIICTLTGAEPIGPKKIIDALIIEPCTGNTLAKLASGIADTPVTLSAKSNLRNSNPVIIAVSTNDALGNAAKNIGALQNAKNIYFVPYRQDDPVKKPNSLVADFSMTYDTLIEALDGKQIQPMIKQ